MLICIVSPIIIIKKKKWQWLYIYERLLYMVYLNDAYLKGPFLYFPPDFCIDIHKLHYSLAKTKKK